MTFDAASFFATIRHPSRCGPLRSAQVQGASELLKALQGQPLAYAAYILATAWHETDGAMEPIKERGGDTYFFRMYDIAGARPQKARELGNVHPGDGVKFAGRGLPQTTGRTNYEKAKAFLGVDCVSNPDLLLDKTNAARWTVHAMVEGLFTGKRLAVYLPPSGVASREQYINARRVVNGTDRADLIEDYAQWFERGLRDGGWA